MQPEKLMKKNTADLRPDEVWLAVKIDYIAGRGSIRELAARHGVSESTAMKRAAREGWAASRASIGIKADAAVEATLQERAASFVHKVADQTDRFVDKVAESEAALEPSERRELRALAATWKDVVSVGRDTYQLRNAEPAACIVNLGFLQSGELPPLIESNA